jgi:hypothetical protein
MGTIFQKVESHLPPANANNMILEIGSDRYEGSTAWLANVAAQRGEEFHTVDICDYAQHRIGAIPNCAVNYHVAQGSVWCQQVLPNLQRKIAMVYLDNFDYMWDITELQHPQRNPFLAQQVQQYQNNFGISMNNFNCQVEHLTQCQSLIPFMAPDGIIVCDDTYTWNDCWVGKCGATVVWLATQGWTVVKYKDNGVILKKQ